MASRKKMDKPKRSRNNGKPGTEGVYIPENPKKYIGSKPPEFKSLWERYVFYWCDTNTTVVKWGYECIVIPYIYAVDSKKHMYHVDLYVEIMDERGVIKKWLLEIKPLEDRTAPKEPKSKSKKALDRFKFKAETFIKNMNKWDAARLYAKQRGMTFKILSENEIF